MTSYYLCDYVHAYLQSEKIDPFFKTTWQSINILVAKACTRPITVCLLAFQPMQIEPKSNTSQALFSSISESFFSLENAFTFQDVGNFVGACIYSAVAGHALLATFPCEKC